MESVRPATREEAAEILRADPVRNYSPLRILAEWDGPRDLHVCGRSAFFRLRDPKTERGFVVLSAATAEEGAALAALVDPGDHSFFTVDAVVRWPDAANEPAGDLIRDHRTDWHNPCRQMSLPDDVVLPEADPEVVPLTPDLAPYIHDHYTMRHALDVDYVEERIRCGPSVGVFRDGRLAGFSMTHDEGTMGVLEVLPEYRRQGLAEKMSVALCRKVREAGGIPTVHIKCGNLASLGLAAKMGYVPTGDVTWVGWR